jgi:hypothetical protein
MTLICGGMMPYASPLKPVIIKYCFLAIDLFRNHSGHFLLSENSKIARLSRAAGIDNRSLARLSVIDGAKPLADVRGRLRRQEVATVIDQASFPCLAICIEFLADGGRRAVNGSAKYSTESDLKAKIQDEA